MYIYNAKITRVIDGDSFVADVDLGFGLTANMKLRAKDLDTPELFRAINDDERTRAYAAKQYAEDLLLGRSVTIKTYKMDGFGRYEAVIYLDGHEDDFAIRMKTAGHEKKLGDQWYKE